MGAGTETFRSKARRVSKIVSREDFLVKNYNNFMSLLLVSAMVAQAGGTCPGGGGGSTPPSLTLPATVTGTETFSFTTPYLYNLAVSSVSSPGVISAGKSYGVWCTNPTGLVPGGGVNPNGTVTPPQDPNNPTGAATYMPVNSYTISGAGGVNYGAPGFTYDPTIPGFTTTSLTLAQEWAAVNWILNNPAGVSGEAPSALDTQAAIWQLLLPNQGFAYLLESNVTTNAWALYKDAITYGLSFIPTTGQVVAVLMVPTTPAGSPTYQGIIIPIPIPCPGTLGGSATLTKTVNVGAGGANAFQLVTYTYTIKNTGSTTLQNLVIVDDNGTPNYPEDDVTINIPAGTTLAPGASYSVTSTVYLPISLFYQSGSEAAFDTLIPQVIPVPTGSPAGTLPNLQLTYLIDADVTDNTYGTGSSAGWAGNGGHTFAEELAGYAEFALYNSRGTLISDFDVNYLKKVTATSHFPSGYASTPGTVSVGGTNYIYYLESTLQDNLNDYPQFVGDTVNSPVAGTPNWETITGYKVLVNEGIFGIYGIGSAAVKKNYLAATETAYSGKCGYARPTTYTPCIYGNLVNSTAYLCAQVCGCSTPVHAKACLTVKLCGAALPRCDNASSHRCQDPVHCSCSCAQCQAGMHGQCTNTTGWGWFTAPAKCTPPVCGCTCAQCKAGNHGACSRVGCTDPTCHANNCTHNTMRCVVASQHVTYTW